MVDQEEKIPKRNKYTSGILKLKANAKIKNNAAVATMTQNNIPTLEDMAEVLGRARSMQEEELNQQEQKRERTVIKIEEAKEEFALGKSPTLPGIDDFIASEGSDSSSFIEDVDTDMFQNSVIQTTQIKEPEDLIDKDLLNMMGFINKMKKPTEEEILTKAVEFGEITRHKLCIFDLDETLIHSKIVPQGAEPPANATFVIELSNGGRFAVFKRPFVEKILEHLSQLWELAIFTAAEKGYADLIIDKIDPENKFFKKRMYRDSCFRSQEGVYVKDLRIIQDREPEDLILIDNCMLSFANQLDNGVPICSYVGNNPQDSELLYLITYLDELYHQDDMREANKRTFKLTAIQDKI